MATLANVVARVQSLETRGQIYYGQPTDKMTAMLEGAARGWTVTLYDEHGPCGEAPWGAGPNEEVSVLVHHAQEILYGFPVAWEVIKRLERRRPGIWRKTTALMAQTRPSGSPYAVDADDLADWLISAELEGIEDVGALDARAISNAVENFKSLRRHGGTVRETIGMVCIGGAVGEMERAGYRGLALRQGAKAVDWLYRRDHKVRDGLVHWETPWPDVAALADDRRAVLLMLFGVPDPREAAKQFASLSDVERYIEAARLVAQTS